MMPEKMNVNERWERVCLTEVASLLPFANPARVLKLKFKFTTADGIHFYKIYGRVAVMKLFFQNTFDISKFEIETLGLEDLCEKFLTRNAGKQFMIYITFRIVHETVYPHISTVAPIAL
jgi:hypothetical protein